MKQNKFIFALLVCIVWNGLQAQQQTTSLTLEKQVQLNRIKQSYIDKGIPEEWAERRAQRIFDNQQKIQTRTTTYASTPVAGSIWLDRDSVTGAPNASYAHNFTPEEFVKDIFVKGGREIADIAIRNVTFISSTWQGNTTNTWNNKGIMGPFGGNTGTWTSNDRELLYFDHGDTTTLVPAWNNIGSVKYFDIDKGFLLATGPGLKAEGNNVLVDGLDGGYADWTQLGGGTATAPNKRDPDLSPIAEAQSLDLETITSLEFDFRSFTDSVTFQFIFASTEYKDFSNSPFNDAFGFFVSGPGLTDEWGNSGDTINIARYPDGAPIAVNASNWGHRLSNSFSAYDPMGSTPVSETAYIGVGGSIDDSPNAIRPQYHRPVYDDINEGLMEYDGHSIVLTAKAKLKKGEWYHMKLAIGNVSDDQYGSGVFLKAGSLDLGGLMSEVLRPYAQTPYDTVYGWNSLYAGCENTINLHFDKSVTDRNIYIHTEGTGADYVYDANSNKYFKDPVKYILPAKDSLLSVKFKVDDEVKNGSQVRFYSEIEGSTEKDTTEIFSLYAKSKTEVVKYHKPTATYAGALEIQTTNGSPYIQRSINKGLTWEFARDTGTGEMKPFSKSQIANLASEEKAYIIYREPNTCSDNDTLYIGKAIGEPDVKRTVTMPTIPGAIVDKEPGKHTIISTDNFSFTITPTGNNANLQLVVTTSRTSIPDSEGVIILKNADGSYTVTIRYIQEDIEIYIDFATSNMAVGNNKIWANGNILYLQTSQTKQAQIYTIAGALVQTVNLTPAETAGIPLPKGFYIVAIDNSTYKVIIK